MPIKPHAPEVSLSTPVAEQSYSSNSDLAIAASAFQYDTSVKSVTIQANEAIVGQSNADEYVGGWMAGPGHYLVQASAIDENGVIGRSVPQEIDVIGEGGSLAVKYHSMSLFGNTIDLTKEGTADWVIFSPVEGWGSAGFSGIVHKYGVQSLISTTLSRYGQDKYYNYNNETENKFSFTDGTPVPDATAASFGVGVNHDGGGMAVSVVADMTPRTLRLYAAMYGDSRGVLKAYLSDGSAPVVIDRQFTSTRASGQKSYAYYEINFQASKPAQTLTVRWGLEGDESLSEPSHAGILQAATLDGNPVPVVSSDVTPPTLVVADPVTGSIVTTQTVTITGTVSDSGSGVRWVTCGGSDKYGTLNADGTFSCTVNLEPLNNNIQISAGDWADNVASINLNLQYIANVGVSSNGAGVNPQKMIIAVGETRLVTFSSMGYQGCGPDQVWYTTNSSVFTVEANTATEGNFCTATVTAVGVGEAKVLTADSAAQVTVVASTSDIPGDQPIWTTQLPGTAVEQIKPIPPGVGSASTIAEPIGYAGVRDGEFVKYYPFNGNGQYGPWNLGYSTTNEKVFPYPTTTFDGSLLLLTTADASAQSATTGNAVTPMALATCALSGGCSEVYAYQACDYSTVCPTAPETTSDGGSPVYLQNTMKRPFVSDTDGTIYLYDYPNIIALVHNTETNADGSTTSTWDKKFTVSINGCSNQKHLHVSQMIIAGDGYLYALFSDFAHDPDTQINTCDMYGLVRISTTDGSSSEITLKNYTTKNLRSDYLADMNGVDTTFLISNADKGVYATFFSMPSADASGEEKNGDSVAYIANVIGGAASIAEMSSDIRSWQAVLQAQDGSMVASVQRQVQSVDANGDTQTSTYYAMDRIDGSGNIASEIKASIDGKSIQPKYAVADGSIIAMDSGTPVSYAADGMRTVMAHDVTVDWFGNAYASSSLSRSSSSASRSMLTNARGAAENEVVSSPLPGVIIRLVNKNGVSRVVDANVANVNPLIRDTAGLYAANIEASGLSNASLQAFNMAVTLDGFAAEVGGNPSGSLVAVDDTMYQMLEGCRPLYGVTSGAACVGPGNYIYNAKEALSELLSCNDKRRDGDGEYLTFKEMLYKQVFKKVVDFISDGTHKIYIDDRAKGKAILDIAHFSNYLIQNVRIHRGDTSKYCNDSLFEYGGQNNKGCEKGNIMKFMANDAGVEAETQSYSYPLLVFFRQKAIRPEGYGRNSANICKLIHEAIHGYTGILDVPLKSALKGPDVCGSCIITTNICQNVLKPFGDKVQYLYDDDNECMKACAWTN